MPSDDKWISGSLPQRGATRRVKPAPFGAKLSELGLRTHRKHAAGRPLEAAIDAQANRPAALPALFAIAVGLVGGVLAAVEQSLLLAGLSLVVSAGGFFAYARSRRSALRRPGTALADLTHSAAELDAFLEQIAADLPEQALQSLAAIKETLARVVDLLADEQATSATAEERFFVSQAIARYLPDICNHYLAARVASRGVELAVQRFREESEREGTPDESLHRQLEVVHSRLQRLLAAAAADAVQRLASHEAFIDSKRQ